MKPEIILNIITLLIALYLALFKSYFQEKGKNITTSEDIEQLTEKIESVKQKFLERNSNLKAKLDLLTNLQIGHKNDERSALISFHNLFSIWLNMQTVSFPNLIDEYDDKEIYKKIHHYNQAYEDVLTAESLLKIYINDKTMEELILDVKVKTLEYLSTNPINKLIELKYNNFEYRSLENILDSTEKSKKHTKILEERTRIKKEYRDNMLVNYKEVIPFKVKYESYLRNYLKKISTETE